MEVLINLYYYKAAAFLASTVVYFSKKVNILFSNQTRSPNINFNIHAHHFSRLCKTKVKLCTSTGSNFSCWLNIHIHLTNETCIFVFY